MSNTKEVQAYTVASGIIVDNQQLLLVQNQRRNGSLDWSTPGGVVDPGEEVLEALQREVIEETSVVVNGWSSMIYSVEVDFVGRDMSLHAQVFRASGYTGALHVDDPDNVVVDGRWVGPAEADILLDTSPQWVAEPLRHHLDAMFAGTQLSGTLLSGTHISGTQTSGTQASGTQASGTAWKYRVSGDAGGRKIELVQAGE